MYRLYLDETGVEAIKRLHSDRFRYLSLSGVVMKLEHARDYLAPSFDKIKADIFDQDPDARICFHRTDIMQCKGPFEPLKKQESRDTFDDRILRVMSDCEYRLITVLVDKAWMVEQEHYQNTHPYHYLMEILVEKYALLLNRMNSTGDIMPEARGKRQDKELQAQFKRCRDKGTRYASVDLISRKIPFSKLKFRTKKDNSAGLQLCDLLAHPSHYTIRQKLGHEVHLGDFCESVSKILLDRKYDRGSYGNVMGYGMKSVP